MCLTSVRLTMGVLVLALSGSALPGAAIHAAGKPAAARSHNVIVILRDQRADLPAVRGARGARAAALASAQAPIVSHMRSAGASRIHGFSLINAVAATVSDAEAEKLAAHPLVQAVVPDRVIAIPKRINVSSAGTGGGAAASATSAALAAANGAGAGALCNTLEPEALQLMNVAFLDTSKPQAQRIVDGNGEFVTGKGVKVAWIADGMDPTLPGFTHTDGTPVFIDYQNFGGDPAGTLTGGGEAFGDASSIAAQDTPNGQVLTFDISKFVNAAHPLPSPCNIRIRGVAPGASLVGLNVSSAVNVTTNSFFVQGIEYAVLNDDVDVINESFGGNPFPDNDNDPIALVDEAAVAAGVTVVVSTGDAGTNGTMGTPSTDARVISSGATTSLRNYAQIGYGAAPFATHGWISGNISSFSSGGFSMSGPRVPDTVAPGDTGWALCSTNIALFVECTNENNAPSPIEQFGGTSESSPLTAGVAALVIQAYRSTHRGTNPSPALVKRILMSSATDLGAPPTEQGAGFINAYQAVKTALAVSDENGHPNVSGGGLLSSPTNVSINDEPRSAETVTVAITNTGKSGRTLSPTLQALGAPFAGQNLTLTLNPAVDPTFPNSAGSPRSYITQTFTVPAGAQHLDAAIAWKAPYFGTTVIAYLGLIDPAGHNVAYSVPQDALGTPQNPIQTSGYGHVDVVHPAAGTWTAIIWTRAPGIFASYSGPVKFSWAVERYVKFGSVAPGTFTVAPGATQWVTARFTMPSQAGDQGVALRLGDGESDDMQSEIPISLRALIPIKHGSGSFSGTLTGGNGRPVTGPTQTFAFDVPPGVNNMALNLQISDPLNPLEGLLVDPNGMEVSVEPNFDAGGNPTGAMQLSRANPMPGRWRFILLVDLYTSGNQLTLPFTAQIGFNTAQVSASGLPNNPGTKLSASAAPVVVPITITNNGGLAHAYFADARVHSYTSLEFGTSPVCTNSAGQTLTQLPGVCFLAALPTQVNRVDFLAQSTVPITMDVANVAGYIVGVTGAPDLFSQPIGGGIIDASVAAPEVPWGLWELFPSEIGPYGPGGAPAAPVATAALLNLKAFDSAVTSDAGDLWSDVTFGTKTYKPLILGPGQSGTIHVTITPSAALVGQTVSGTIYIDTFSGTVQTGDEVVALPYSYTVTQ